MEKPAERKLQKKVDTTSMGEHQSILFLEKGGGNLLSNTSKEPRNILLDYHKYYLFQKKLLLKFLNISKKIEKNMVSYKKF